MLTLSVPTIAGPTTPSSMAMGNVNVKLPDNSDVVVTLWAGKQGRNEE
jgi:hypothetical protein